MKRRVKIGISISYEVLRAAERLRKETGESRSAVCERGLASLVATRENSLEAKRYIDGYRRKPESRDEVRGALATATALFATEDPDEPW